MSEHDVVFRDVTVIDGTGGARRVGDLAVVGDRISTIGDRVEGRGAVEIDDADLTLFDAATIRDVGDFAKPVQAAAGVLHVWTNGVCVWRDGGSTGARPGRALRRR